MRTCWILALAVVALAPAGRANPQPTGKPVQASFATKAAAEQAAPRFGCSGAHRMGDLWFPCASHGQMTESPASGGHAGH